MAVKRAELKVHLMVYSMVELTVAQLVVPKAVHLVVRTVDMTVPYLAVNLVDPMVVQMAAH